MFYKLLDNPGSTYANQETLLYKRLQTNFSRALQTDSGTHMNEWSYTSTLTTTSWSAQALHFTTRIPVKVSEALIKRRQFQSSITVIHETA